MTAALTVPTRPVITDADIALLCAEFTGLSIHVVNGIADVRFARPVTTRTEVQVLRRVERLTDLFTYHGPMSWEVEPAEQAEALLSALGDTSDRVGAVLSAMHIRGFRGDLHCCPLAAYLRARGLPVDEVSWCSDSAESAVTFEVLDGVQPRYGRLTAAANEFAQRFDEDVYFRPELVPAVSAVAA